MANNQYVNKVVYGNQTLIDTSSVTVTPDKLLDGYTALDKTGQLITGTAPAGAGSTIVVTDENDSHGGIHRIITAVSLEGDTVTAAHLESGYTAHNSLGQPITGTLQPGVTPTGTISITTNGTHDVTNYASAIVSVQAGEPNLQAKTGITPTESSQTVTADTGYDGLSSVQIDPVSSAYVGSGITRQAAKTVTPSESEQTAVAANVYTTGIVKVGAISSTYVGSGIDQNDSSDLTASGATVNVPAGYYAEAASKSVATTTHPVPTASVNSANGLVTASHTQSTGYVTGGTTTGTLQLTTQAAATITPSETAQTAVPAGRYTTGAVTVGAVSSTYVGSGVTRKAAATITPTKSTQTIASGTYLTGTQTIAAIPAAYQDVTGVTAAAGDVVSGKTIVDSTGATVNGSLVIQHYYTGSSAPSASTGSDGDIYLQMA